MSLIVSGAPGFLSSHLCERLLRRGRSARCVDNLCTGAHGNIATFVLQGAEQGTVSESYA